VAKFLERYANYTKGPMMSSASEIFRSDAGVGVDLMKRGAIDILAFPFMLPIALFKFFVGIGVVILGTTFFLFDRSNEKKVEKKMMKMEDEKWSLIGIENPKIEG